MSQHKGLNKEEELCRDKRQLVATDNEKNMTNQLRHREFMLRQDFQQVVNIRQDLCRDIDYFNMKKLLGQKKSFKERIFS